NFAGRHASGADGQVQRVARTFGLLAAAGELAIGYCLFPWPEGEAVRAASRCFADWLSDRGGTGAAEIAGAISHLRATIERHGLRGSSVPESRSVIALALSGSTTVTPSTCSSQKTGDHSWSAAMPGASRGSSPGSAFSNAMQKADPPGRSGWMGYTGRTGSTSSVMPPCSQMEARMPDLSRAFAVLGTLGKMMSPGIG